MTAIYSIQTIKTIETQLSKAGFNLPDLMQWAGESAWKIVMEHWPHAKRIVVLCGYGNNAGDGYVLASSAHRAGKEVHIYFLKDPKELKEPAHQKAQCAQSLGIVCQPWQPNVNLNADVVVDALLGTGFVGPLALECRAAIQALALCKAPILAIDIPSGLQVETGVVNDCAVVADVTVTMIGMKLGLVTADALDYVGEVVVVSPKQAQWLLSGAKPAAIGLSSKEVFAYLPHRRFNTHKGSYGHVLIVGGMPGFSGAARLAAEAALRVGAGVVSVATHPEHAAFFNLMCPELMCHGINAPEDLDPLLERATVVVLGPGLGSSDWSHAMWKKVIHTKKPLVLDADGLNFLAKQPTARDQWILTPHPGEAARLLKQSTAMIQHNRWEALSALEKRYQGIIVLKGCGTLISAPDETVRVNAYGNSAMASPGMGDVLSGLIGGLVAQGLSLYHAAQLGVFAQTHAADQLTKNQAAHSILASDLLPRIPSVLAQCDV